MTVNIGIFENEKAVLEGVRLLREAGVDQSEMRIVVDNLENTPLITSNADVPIEELSAIRETSRESDGGVSGVMPVTTGYPIGNSSNNSGPGGFVFAGPSDKDGPHHEEVLKDIGIPSSAAAACGEAVEAGHYLLVTDAGETIRAEAIMRNAGARNVVH
jgi:hypothetical protein